MEIYPSDRVIHHLKNWVHAFENRCFSLLIFRFSSWYLFPFKVILDDLPNEFATALREYNRQVTDVFSQYLTAVAADLEKERGEENKLPLSGIGKIRSLIILYVTVFFFFEREVKFLIRFMASSLVLQGSVFSWKQLFIFDGFDKNYTWHFLSLFFLFVCFLQVTLTSQFCATAKRCIFGNYIRSKGIILYKFLTLG